MVEIFFQQAAVAAAGGVAFAEKLLGAKFIPRRFILRRETGGEFFAAFRQAAGVPGQFFRCEAPGWFGDLEPVVGTFDHHPAVEGAKPLEIETVGPMFGRLAAGLTQPIRLLHRDIIDPPLAGGGDVPGFTRLTTDRGRRGQWNRGRILENEPASRQIGVAIACQIEFARFRHAVEPDASGHKTTLAIVDLTAPNIFMKPPSHFDTVGQFIPLKNPISQCSSETGPR